MTSEGVLKLHSVQSVPQREGGLAVDTAGKTLRGRGLGTQRRHGMEGGQRLEAVGRGVLLQAVHGQGQGATFGGTQVADILSHQTALAVAHCVLSFT